MPESSLGQEEEDEGENGGGKGCKQDYQHLYQGHNSNRCKDSSKPIAWVVKVDLEVRWCNLWQQQELHNIIQVCIREEHSRSK